jgi:hypothetical protein
VGFILSPTTSHSIVDEENNINAIAIINEYTKNKLLKNARTNLI